MFGKLFALFALVAVAMAAPKPAPAPAPQVFTYSAGLDYVYPSAAVGAAALPAAAYYAPYGAAPLAYSALPAAGYYLR